MTLLSLLAAAPVAAAAAAESTPLELGKLLGILAAAIVFLLFLIMVVRLQAFIALLVTSIGTAIAAGMPLTEITGTVEAGMGSSLGFIATIIGLGAMFGQVLEHSGGAKTLANTLLKSFGERRAPMAMMLTGFIISIPVFFDVGLVILAPILYSLARQTGKSLLYFGLPLIAGMAVTHAFVPPTPGPAVVAYLLNVNLGYVIGFGVLVGLPTAIIAGLVVSRRMGEAVFVAVPAHLEKPEPEGNQDLPGFGTVIFLISLPIVLILGATVIEQVVAQQIPAGLTREARGAELSVLLRNSPIWMQVIYFLGSPLLALIITTLFTLVLLGIRRGSDRHELLELCTKSLGPAGMIILITGAGGVFKNVLIQTGIAEAIKDSLEGSLPAVALGFVAALLIRVAQGSATVAMMTAAGIMAAVVSDLSQAQTALVVVAIASGATAFSHVNDSGFWIVNRYFGMTEKDTLKTWTVVSTVIGFVGFGFAFLLSLFI